MIVSGKPEMDVGVDQASLPPVGFDEASTRPSESTATQVVLDGAHETAPIGVESAPGG